MLQPESDILVLSHMRAVRINTHAYIARSLPNKKKTKRSVMVDDCTKNQTHYAESCIFWHRPIHDTIALHALILMRVEVICFCVSVPKRNSLLHGLMPSMAQR